ncbi:MAG: metallophosphoesterase family protein [Anaerolineae bacterium]|nr:metallophosphoesterase family protein [Anaerolineae bacterium]
MKLLLFSDVHSSLWHCERLVEQADDVDLVIGAGDLGNVRRGLERTVKALGKIKKPTVLVPGNSESDEELLAVAGQFWPAATVLHGTGTEIAGIPFFGIGGGIPITPFGAWSFDFSEDEAETLLANCPPAAVLISHSPPKGAVDVSSSGRSLGSVAVRAAIERLQPRLVVCGHIHASAGQHQMIGDTPVVNAGPDGLMWELEVPAN